MRTRSYTTKRDEYIDVVFLDMDDCLTNTEKYHGELKKGQTPEDLLLPGVIAFIKKQKDAGRKVALITNGDLDGDIAKGLKTLLTNEGIRLDALADPMDCSGKKEASDLKKTWDKNYTIFTNFLQFIGKDQGKEVEDATKKLRHEDSKTWSEFTKKYGKPNVAMAIKAFEQLGITPKEYHKVRVVMAGDQKTDIQFAECIKKIGVQNSQGILILHKEIEKSKEKIDDSAYSKRINELAVNSNFRISTHFSESLEGCKSVSEHVEEIFSRKKQTNRPRTAGMIHVTDVPAKLDSTSVVDRKRKEQPDHRNSSNKRKRSAAATTSLTTCREESSQVESVLRTRRARATATASVNTHMARG